MIKNTAVLKKDAHFFTCFGKSLIFLLLPFVFDSRHGSTELFILVVLPLSSNILLAMLKSVSMTKPGRTRQEVIQLKSPILLKLGMNVGFGEQMIMPRT